MRRVGILLGFILIATILIRVNIINTNRLISDSITFEERRIHSDIGKKINKTEVTAKVDFYSNPEGYLDDGGVIHIDSETQSTDSHLSMISFNEFVTTEPLLIRTNKGCVLTLPFENFQWKYDRYLVGWDGEKVTLPGKEEAVSYRYYRFNVLPGGNELVKNIYSLDYYEEIEQEAYSTDYILDLQGSVGILVKMKNSAVERYTILNSVIEDYDWGYVYNLQGKEIVEVRRDFLAESLPVGDTGLHELVEGHSIKVKMDTPEELTGEFRNHKLIRIRSSIHDGVVPDDGEGSIKVFLPPQIEDDVELSVYGTDIFTLQIWYKRQLR